MEIYRIVNTITGDDYIGKTGIGIQKRLRTHYYKSNTGSQTYLHRAIRKYGIDHFTTELMESQVPQTQINVRESFWIDKFKPTYNLTSGGEGGDTSNSPNYIAGMKRRSRILTDEHKRNISETLRKTPIDRTKQIRAMNESIKKRVIFQGMEFPSITAAKQYCKDNNIKASVFRRLNDPRYVDCYYLD